MITVIGSSNTDMAVKTKKMPLPGETVIGGVFSMVAGGKGANQAVCAAKLGYDVTFVTRLGNDMFGKKMLEDFAEYNMDTSHIKLLDGVSSGVALIMVDENAENSIVVASGANMCVTTEAVEAASEAIKNSDALLVQFEIPMKSVERAIDIAYDAKTKIIVNPAPANTLSLERMKKIDVLIPNQYEALQLLGKDPTAAAEPEDLAKELMKLGVGAVVITLGSKGALVCEKDKTTLIPAKKVKAIDTTGAGDSFAAALTCALTDGKELCEAAEFATKVSAITVTRFGAQTSLPTIDEIEA